MVYPPRVPKGYRLHLDERSYVEEDRGYVTPCWIWQGAPDANGYGRYWSGPGSTLAARRMYLKHRGPIAPGLMPDHLCRIRICVNPDHLEIVTNAENQQRGLRSPLTPADVEAIRASDEGPVALGRRYGVHYSTIWGIRTRRHWS